MLLHVSIAYRISSSGSTYCSLLKSRVKIMNISLLWSMWQHIVYLYVRCFQCREVLGLAVHIPPCTGNNAHTNTSPHNSPHWKQRTHRYTICCHIDHNNEIFIILTRDFNKEQYLLHEDDMRYAIETCRSILSVWV